jgi:hypothetical protein
MGMLQQSRQNVAKKRANKAQNLLGYYTEFFALSQGPSPERIKGS